MIEYVLADDGEYIPWSTVAKTYEYDGNDNLISVSCNFNGKTYKKTYSYTGENLTGETMLEKQ